MRANKPDRGMLLRPANMILHEPKSPWVKNAQERAAMTLQCKDGDDIPRVKNAGQTTTIKGTEVQVMHNGLYVKKNGYQGTWQAEIIKGLKGIHEPQEEKVFYEVLKKLTPGSTMIELGSWWCYYSMWFLKTVKRGIAICCEPDPANLELGKANASLNGFTIGQDIVFYDSAAGSRDGATIEFKNEDQTINTVTIRSVDSIVAERKLKTVDVLHLDIQGAELDALKGASASIKAGKVRFVFVSTHHYSISGDPLMHQKCLDFIRKNGGHIVSQHTVLESCSGDGLIVASFNSQDKDFKVNISLQPSDESLFRAYEYDVDILWQAHDALVKYVKKLEKDNLKHLEQLRSELEWKSRHIDNLESQLAEIGHLKQHIKRQVKLKINKVTKKLKP